MVEISDKFEKVESHVQSINHLRAIFHQINFRSFIVDKANKIALCINKMKIINTQVMIKKKRFVSR